MKVCDCQNIRRIIAFSLLMTFSSTTFAQPLTGPSSPVSSAWLIPAVKEWGSISTNALRQNGVNAQNDGPLVIYIQDAHANYAAQKNIFNIIRGTTEAYLENARRQGIPAQDVKIGIAVEGFEGSPDFSSIRQLPSGETREKIADAFMKQALLTGPEFAAFTSAYPFEYFGVDDQAFLDRDIDLYFQVLKRSRELKPVLDSLDVKIRDLRRSSKNRGLQLFYTRREDAKTNPLHYGDYLNLVLENTAGNSTDGKLLREAFAAEQKIDNTQLENEMARAGENWRKLSGVSLLFYPEIRKQLKREKLFQELKEKNILSEVPKLEFEAKKRLIRDAQDRVLDQLMEAREFLGSMLDLTMSPEQFERYRLMRRPVLSALRKAAGSRTEYVQLSQALKEAEAFYVVAKKRDVHMTQNLMTGVQERGLQICFLVAGGFHARGLETGLESAGIHYLSVMPKIETFQKQDKDLYRLRLGGSTDLSANSVWERPLGRGTSLIPAFVTAVRLAGVNPAMPVSTVLGQVAAQYPRLSAEREPLNLAGQTWAGLTGAAKPLQRDLSAALRAQGYSEKAIGRLTGNPTLAIADPVSGEEVEVPFSAAVFRLDDVAGRLWLAENRTVLNAALQRSEVRITREEFYKIGKPVGYDLAGNPLAPHPGFSHTIFNRVATELSSTDVNTRLGIGSNSRTVPRLGALDYPAVKPIQYGEARNAIDKELGREALRNGQFAKVTAWGGYAGRAFGREADEYKRRRIKMPVVSMFGREIDSAELVLGHLRWASRKYRKPVPMYVLTNEFTHATFQQELKDNNNYGLEPGQVQFYPVGSIPGFNPYRQDLIDNFFESDKDNPNFNPARPEDQPLNDRKRKADLTDNIPAEWTDWTNEQIVDQIIADNGGEGGIFRFEDNSIRWKSPGHLQVLTNLFTEGMLYEMWKRGERYLNYANDTDLGQVVSEDLLSIFIDQMQTKGAEMLTVLIPKNITYTIPGLPEGQNQVIMRKKLIGETHEQGFKWVTASKEAGTTVDDGKYEILPPDAKDQLTVIDRATAQPVGAPAKGKAEKGGVPVSLNGKTALGEAWAVENGDVLDTGNIPDYNTAQYIISIEAVFQKFFGISPEEFPALIGLTEGNYDETRKNSAQWAEVQNKARAKYDELLDAIYEKVGLYWEIKPVLDLNTTYQINLPGADQPVEVVVANDQSKVAGLPAGYSPVWNDEGRLVQVNDASGLAVAFYGKGIEIVKDHLRFIAEPAELLGDATFLLNTVSVTIDRDGKINDPDNDVLYAVLKSPADVPKYAKPTSDTLNEKVDLYENPADPSSPVHEDVKLKPTDFMAAGAVKKAIAQQVKPYTKKVRRAERKIQSVTLQSGDPSVAEYFAQSFQALNEFLNNPATRQDKKVIFVLGHTTPDPDAIFSSFSRAYLKHLELLHQGDTNTIVVPLINTLTDDEKAKLAGRRGDIAYLLEALGLNAPDQVAYFSDIAAQLDSISTEQLEIILTDHNTLHPSQQKYAGQVIEVMDHHDTTEVPSIQARYPKAATAVRRIGSSSTLIAGLITNPEALRPDLALLLSAGLISDTVNLTDASKVTAADKKAAKSLVGALGQPRFDEVFAQMDARLLSIQAADDNDLLARDPKDFPVPDGTGNYAMRSLAIAVDEDAFFDTREASLVQALDQERAGLNAPVSILNVGFRSGRFAVVYVAAVDAAEAQKLAEAFAAGVDGLTIDTAASGLPANTVKLNYNASLISRKDKLKPIVDQFLRSEVRISREEFYKIGNPVGYDLAGNPLAPHPGFSHTVFNRIATQLSGTDVNTRLGIGSNSRTVPRLGELDYPSTKPIQYGEARKAINQELGREALRQGQLAKVTAWGGYAGRAFGREADEYKRRRIKMPVVSMFGREIDSEELVLAHLRWASREYGKPVPMYVLTNEFTHATFQQELKDNNNYGLEPGQVQFYPVGSIPGFNPYRQDLIDNFFDFARPDQPLNEAKRKGDLTDNIPAEWADWNNEQIVDQIIADNGGEGGIFRFEDNSIRWKSPGHLQVLTNLFTEGMLYEMWKRGERYLNYANDTDLGQVVSEDLLSIFIDQMQTNGAEMMTVLIPKNITYTIPGLPDGQNQVIVRKKLIGETHEQGFERIIAPKEAGTTVDLDKYELQFDEKDQLTVIDKTTTQAVGAPAKGKAEKGGVPVSLNGKTALAEAWAVESPTLDTGNIPDYNTAQYIISIEAVFQKFFGISPEEFPALIGLTEGNYDETRKNPAQWAEVQNKARAKYDELLDAIYEKVGLYWEIKPVLDLNTTYQLNLPGVDEPVKVVVANDQSKVAGLPAGYSPVWNDGGRLVQINDASGLAVAFYGKGIEIIKDHLRFIEEPAELLGDAAFLLNTVSVTIDRDGKINDPDNDVLYAVLKAPADVPKYAKPASDTLSGKVDLFDNPADANSQVHESAALTPADFMKAKDVKTAIAEQVKPYTKKVRRSEMRYAGTEQISFVKSTDALVEVLSKTGIAQKPVAIVYDGRLPSAEELAVLAPLTFARVSIRWNKEKYPDIASRQAALSEAGLDQLVAAKVFHGRLFTNLMDREGLDSAISAQTKAAGKKRTVVISEADELREVGLLLRAGKIKHPLAAALVLGLVEGEIENLPPEFWFFKQQGNEYGFSNPDYVNDLLDNALNTRLQVLTAA